ncbi:protein abrupt isoform X5 [Contarinia nasturtii]|uniref:protein abrupt isoform X5 n=1 Tax=Contarinia nasturtii TaxID=265458 RepID=UPI0012D3EB48|nr:protein abrupt isoform X5 [Contarinia nasturtii]
MTESTLLQTTENNNTTTIKMDRAGSPSPSEQQYALKWNDFQSSILSSFRHLRDEEDFVDVTLACDIRSFTAHKVVLSACSPYFRKLLKANPCEHPIVILRDIRAEDVESLLRFMYNGEVHIGHEQLSDFLKTAQLLQVRGLADVTGPQTKGLPLSTSLIPESNSSSTAVDMNSIRSGIMGSSLPNPLSVVNTVKLQESKASPVRNTSTSLPWELSEDRRKSHLTPPPPQKRIKSADLYRAQHGINPDVDAAALKDVQPLLAAAAAYRGRERNRSKENLNRSRDSSSQDLSKTELRDSLLGQALESSASTKKHPDLTSLQAQSTGEDSNSSDHSAASDAGDYDDTMNSSMDQRFSNFLGLQGIPGLLPGPSGMGDGFDDDQGQQRDCNTTPANDGIVKQEVNDDDCYSPSSMASSNTSKTNQQNVSYNKASHSDAVSYRDQQRNNLLSASILLSRSRHASATELLTGYLVPCPLCEVPLEPRLFRQHLDRHYPRDSPVCPVLECCRRFAHPNSVRNHMRIKHTMQWNKMKLMRSSGGPFGQSGVTDYK